MKGTLMEVRTVGGHQRAEVADEASLKLGKSQETLPLLVRYGNGSPHHRPDLLRVHTNAISGDDITDKDGGGSHFSAFTKSW